MSGRDAVRAMRQSGGFVTKAPPPQVSSSLIFWAITVGVAVLAFLGALYLLQPRTSLEVLPLERDLDDSFEDVPVHLVPPT